MIIIILLTTIWIIITLGSLKRFPFFLQSISTFSLNMANTFSLSTLNLLTCFLDLTTLIGFLLFSKLLDFSELEEFFFMFILFRNLLIFFISKTRDSSSLEIPLSTDSCFFYLECYTFLLFVCFKFTTNVLSEPINSYGFIVLTSWVSSIEVTL